MGNELRLVTERVVAFKDGYCLTIKRAQGTADAAGELYTDDVPEAAVLGSFWAQPQEGRLVSMTAGWTTARELIERELPCTQPIEILQANQGQACRVVLQDKGEYQGTIRGVLAETTAAAVPAALREAFGLPAADDDPLAALLADAAPAQVRQAATLDTVSGGHFVLTTAEGDILLPVGQVKTLSIQTMRTTIKRTVHRGARTKRLTFRFEQPGREQQLRLMYFAPGLRWIPTYRVELARPGEKQLAQVNLQAEMINEHEPLSGVPVDIVVGVPNFRFRQTVSPLSLEQSLRAALSQVAPALGGNYRNDISNAMYTQRAGEFRRQAAAAGAQPEQPVDLPGELTAAAAQDLFVYSLPPLNLRRGERTAVHIFSAEVPYRDVYTWDLSLKRQDIEAAPSGSGVQSPLTLSKNEVWHQVELTNTTQLPWTTGAVMLMQGSQPLAQELLTYTSPSDPVRVPVTVSVETRGTFAEQETARQLNALNWDDHRYAKITKQAQLHLSNSKPLPIDVEITFRCGGRAHTATADGAVTLAAFAAQDWDEYRGSPAVNNSSQVRWQASLKPGESFEPAVIYDYFARH
jgi:hypothetical protein